MKAIPCLEDCAFFSLDSLATTAKISHVSFNLNSSSHLQTVFG
jgi:hypothetical protein